MLLNAFLQSFESLPPEKYRTLGGRLGWLCARRLAYARFPERFPPAPRAVRELDYGSRAQFDEVELWDFMIVAARKQVAGLRIPYPPPTPALLSQARERVLLALGATEEILPDREYGPDFSCHDCGGAGTRKCGYCTDEGISTRSLKDKHGNPKPGTACKRFGCDHGRRACGCDGGRLTETEIGFPCAWCPSLRYCYGDLVKVEMPKRDYGRPRMMIERERYEASGITFTNPEGRA